MNLISEFLHLISTAFEHIIGDPVHTQSATAVKSTLQTAAQVVESGDEDHFKALHEAVEKVTSTGRAPTPEEWAELHSTAQSVAKKVATEAAEPAASAPEAPDLVTEQKPPAATEIAAPGAAEKPSA